MHNPTQEKLYVLKTYELEIKKDEEMEKGSKKGKTVALVAEKNEEHGTTLQNVNAKDTPSMKAYEERTEAGKGNVKLMEEDDESSTQAELDDIDEHLAFLLIKFSKAQVQEKLYNL